MDNSLQLSKELCSGVIFKGATPEGKIKFQRGAKTGSVGAVVNWNRKKANAADNTYR